MSRLRLASACTLVGGLLFWLALRSGGFDWYYSETYADVVYTAARFHELPFFSFALRGGTYLLQDPQASLLSPGSLLVLLAGPSVGLRLMAFFWGALGCWAYVAWMRRRVSPAAALVGAVGWILGLGVSWRVVVGNDMFLWHLALPLFLLLIEDCVRAPRPRSAIALGLLAGGFALGPSFHSIVFLLAPALTTFAVVEVVSSRPDARRSARIAATLAAALALAVVVAAPKLVAWTQHDLRRPIPMDKIIGVADALRSLCDYSIVKAVHIPTIGPQVHQGDSWGVWECAAALPPPALLLAVLGIACALRDGDRRRTAVWGTILIVVGMGLACCQTAWDVYRHAFGGGLRVAPRLLGVAAFGLSLFAALGADAVIRRIRHGWAWLLTALLLMGACFVLWTRAIDHVDRRIVGDPGRPQPIAPLAQWRRERDKVDGLAGFKDLVRFGRMRRDLLDGHGYLDSIEIVGGGPAFGWPLRGPLPLVEGVPPDTATVTHTRVTLRGLGPGQGAWLRIQEPRYGFTIATEPPRAPVALVPFGAGVSVMNLGTAPIDRIEIRPVLPVSRGWFLLSGAAVVAAAAALVRRPRRALEVPSERR